MPCMTQIKIMNTEKQIYEKYDKEEVCRPSWVGRRWIRNWSHPNIKSKIFPQKISSKSHFDLNFLLVLSMKANPPYSFPFAHLSVKFVSPFSGSNIPSAPDGSHR